MFTTNTTTSSTGSATSNSHAHSIQPASAIATSIGGGNSVAGMPVLTPQLPFTVTAPSANNSDRTRGSGSDPSSVMESALNSDAQASTWQVWNNLLANMMAQQRQQQQMAAAMSTATTGLTAGGHPFINGVVPFPSAAQHQNGGRPNSALTNELLAQMLAQARAGNQQFAHQPLPLNGPSAPSGTSSSSSSSVFDPSALPNMMWLSQTLASIYGYDQLKQLLLEHQQAQQRQQQSVLLSQLLFGNGGGGQASSSAAGGTVPITGLGPINQADIMRLADATQALINLNTCGGGGGGGGGGDGRDRSGSTIGHNHHNRQQQIHNDQPLDLTMGRGAQSQCQSGRKNSRAGRAHQQQQPHCLPLPPSSFSAIGHRPASVIHSSSQLQQPFGLPIPNRAGGAGGSGTSVKRSSSSVSHLLSPSSLLKNGVGGEEPDVGDHFRRSLSGKWPKRIHSQPHHYASTPASTRKASTGTGTSSKCRSIYYNEANATVEDHFRKALGDDYRQRYFSKEDQSANSTTTATTSTTSINEECCSSTTMSNGVGAEMHQRPTTASSSSSMKAAAEERMDEDGEGANWLSVDSTIDGSIDGAVGE